VAHNAALTWKRGVTTYRRHVDRFELLAESPAGPEPDRDREMLAFVYAEIRQLPPVDRSLLLLHLDEVGYAEIAEILGLSESNVGARLTRIRQRLVTTLQEKTHELR
jgi:RNA polymerase sigma-70 factor (ECF subfamily)